MDIGWMWRALKSKNDVKKKKVVLLTSHHTKTANMKDALCPLFRRTGVPRSSDSMRACHKKKEMKTKEAEADKTLRSSVDGVSAPRTIEQIFSFFILPLPVTLFPTQQHPPDNTEPGAGALTDSSPSLFFGWRINYAVWVLVAARLLRPNLFSAGFISPPSSKASSGNDQIWLSHFLME